MTKSSCLNKICPSTAIIYVVVLESWNYCVVPLQTDCSTSWPSGHWTHRLPTSPWHKTNLRAFICVGGSPPKAWLQDWRLPINAISFWQAARGVSWHHLYTDTTWQATSQSRLPLRGVSYKTRRNAEENPNCSYNRAVVDVTGATFSYTRQTL